jgi:hypothetical protein
MAPVLRIELSEACFGGMLAHSATGKKDVSPHAQILD